MDMCIDISIVTYNSGKWMDQFFNSLMNQSFPLSAINLYFTDNSSTDNTVEILENMKESYGGKFKSIVIQKNVNNGFGNGHNKNIFSGKSPFILVTNVDLEFEKDTLVNLVEYAKNDDATVASWEARQKPYEHPKYYNPITLETNWSSSACVLLRRTAIEQIGGYEKLIFMYGEDVDLSYRLRDAGYKLKYYPIATVWHYTYEYENQVKPLQFFGSTMANVLLRCRFGSKRDIIEGFLRYLLLLRVPGAFPHQRLGVLKNFFKLLCKAPAFLNSRKKSDLQFRFLKWDYEILRDGAFYEYPDTHKNNSFDNNFNPLVSIIMRTYGNRLENLKEAVQSVINQTYRNIELVVIEDGSNFAEEYIKTIPSEQIKKTTYVSMEKAGRCVGGNKGLEAAAGEYCLFLDDDDAIYPDHIEVLVNTIKKENVMAAYSNAFEVETEYISTSPLKYDEIMHSVIFRQPFSRSIMWHHNYIPIQAIMFSRKLYEQYGGFDLELENLEDWNLWTRYSLKHDFAYVAKTTSMYRVPANKKISEKRQQLLHEYYDIAKKKQESMMLNISVAEFLKLQEQVYPPATIANSIVNTAKENLPLPYLKYARKFYHFSKRIYHKFF